MVGQSKSKCWLSRANQLVHHVQRLPWDATTCVAGNSTSPIAARQRFRPQHSPAATGRSSQSGCIAVHSLKFDRYNHPIGKTSVLVVPLPSTAFTPWPSVSASSCRATESLGAVILAVMIQNAVAVAIELRVFGSFMRAPGRRARAGGLFCLTPSPRPCTSAVSCRA